MQQLRVVDTGPGEPVWNMAVDEALLLAADVPTLRLYSWRPAAVSLGRFQALTDFADLPTTVPVVHRITGGGAIHHDQELTFALVVEPERLPAAVAESYRLVHDTVVAVLAELGVAARRQPAGDGPHPRPTNRWCFAVPSQHDLVTEQGRKLVGSAQRRIRRPRAAVLHHGSLVLRQPSLTPFTAAVADQVDPGTVAAELGRRLAAALGRLLALTPTAGPLHASELRLAERLRLERVAGGEPHLGTRGARAGAGR